MADKTIGELPEALEVQDDSLLVMEQQGEARCVRGERIKKYAREGAQEQAKVAKGHAEAAQKSQEAAAESARDAMSLALHPPILKDGSDHWWTWSTEAGDYVESGIDAGVSLTVYPETITGEPGSAAKVENIGTRTDPVLRFTLPRGDKGEPGTGDMDAAPTEGSQNAVQSGGVWDALQRKPNPNLLDNWYFVGGGSQQGGGQFPINQLGQTEYIGKCCNIDRWSTNTTDGLVALTDDGIVLDPSGVSVRNIQLTWLALIDEVITFSILTTDGVLKSVTVKATAGNGEKGSVKIDNANAYAVIYRYASGIGVFVSSGTNQVKLIAVKLELGPTQTLAHLEGDTWVLNEIPSYAEEYAKCIQYSPINGEFVGSRHSNSNLLINSDFKSPINQRGEKTYKFLSGHQYTIDGWFVTRGDIALTDSGLTLTTQSGKVSSWMGQSIENYGSLDKTATISALLSNNVLLTATGNTKAAFYSPVGAEEYSVKYEPKAHSSLPTFEIWKNDEIVPTASIVATKFELGSQQTLAHKEGDTWVLNDPPPNYAEELMKCQRYQLVLGDDSRYCSVGLGQARTTTNISATFSTPCTLRSTPTCSLIGGTISIRNKSAIMQASEIRTDIAGFNSCMCAITAGNLLEGAIYEVFLSPKVKIILDANL